MNEMNELNGMDEMKEMGKMKERNQMENYGENVICQVDEMR
jgi:hypothetical protein